MSELKMPGDLYNLTEASQATVILKVTAINKYGTMVKCEETTVFTVPIENEGDFLSLKDRISLPGLKNERKDHDQD